MAGTNLGTAYVQIVPTAKGIAGSISDAMSGEASSAGTKAGGLFGKLFNSKVAKVAAIGGAALAAGVGIGINALKNGIKETAAYGDEVDKMSQKLGLSSDAYQKWGYVMNLAGTDINKMGPGIKSLTNQLASAQSGNQGAIEAFEQLGISMEEASSMSREDLFGAAIAGLQGMEDSTERAALANKLFGRSGQELAPLLNQSSEATQEQMALAEKYGMVMPEEAVKASAAFQDSVTTMQMTMTGLKNRMMAEFLPSVTQITDGLGKMFAGDMSGVDDIAAGIQGIIAKIGEMAPQIWAAAKRLGGQLLQGIMSNSGEMGQKAGVLIGQLVTGFIQLLPKLAATGLRLVVGLAKGLIQALPQVVSAIGRIGSRIVHGLGAALWGRITAAANGIKERFLTPINNLKEKVSGIIDKIKGFFSFSVSAPHIPLPHFTISPAGWKLKDLLEGVKPSLSISWYDKGGVFTSPSVIGVGERRPEFVGALDDLRKIVREESASGGDNIVINVYATEGMDVNKLAYAVEQRLIQMQKRRTLAWQ